MENKLSFEVQKFSIMDNISDEQFAFVEVYVCHDGNNAHNMPISFEALEKAKDTLKNKFLVAGYNGRDFKGHEKDEMIVGFFPESSKMWFEEMNGRHYLVAEAIMSKIYAKWAYDIFVESNKKDVSMEITVLETEDHDNLIEIKDFVFNGVTILGNSHLPACEGANASIIKFSKENALQAYNSHFSSDNIKKKYIERMAPTKKKEKEIETVNYSVEEETEDTTYMEGSIRINNDKESAVKSSSWDNPDKTLYEPILKATNKKALVKEAYLIVQDGYEEAPSEHLKYPHHQIKGGELVLNERGVIAAFQRASQEGIVSGDVKAHLLRHYRELGLSTENFETLMEGDGKMNEKMEDKATREEIEKDDEKEALKKQKEDEKSDRDDAKEEAKKKEEDERSEIDDYREEEKEEKMECDSEKMAKLEKENEELKAKVAKYEEAEKAKEVETVLAEVRELFSEDEISELRSSAENYSLDSINVFENEVKAKAFEAMKNIKKAETKSFTKMDINSIDKEDKQKSKYTW